MLNKGLVGVAGDDHAEAGGDGVEVEVGERVDHVNEVAFEGEELYPGGDGGEVDVAVDGGDGGYFSEVVEDRWVADVASMQDVVDTLQGGEDLRAEEVVGVGDDAEAHCGWMRRISGSGRETPSESMRPD